MFFEKRFNFEQAALLGNAQIVKKDLDVTVAKAGKQTDSTGFSPEELGELMSDGKLDEALALLDKYNISYQQEENDDGSILIKYKYNGVKYTAKYNPSNTSGSTGTSGSTQADAPANKTGTTGNTGETDKIDGTDEAEKTGDIGETVDKDAVKSEVIDAIYAEIKEYFKSSDSVTNDTIKTLMKELEAAADKFIASYTGSDLQTDLLAYLNNYLKQTDADKMSTEAGSYRINAGKLDGYIDSNELKQLKEYAKTFLLAAINKGVSVELGGIKITSETTINSALAKFTDGDELKDAMEKLISSLNTTNLLERTVTQANEDAAAAEEKKFTDIKGSEYAIDASMIDRSQTSFKSSKFFNNYVLGTGTASKSDSWYDDWDAIDDMARDDAKFDAGKKLRKDDSLKAQIKEQIENMLATKGIPFSQIEALFENVYYESIETTINGMTVTIEHNDTGKTREAYATIDAAALFNNFIATFNENITKAIDEMNASETDFDIQDIDYSVCVDEDNKSKLNNITTKTNEAAYKLKPQLLEKAKQMCAANGIEFDEKAFETIFNNAIEDAKGSSLGDSIATMVYAILYDEDSARSNSKNFLNLFKASYTEWVEKQKKAG